MPIGPPLQPAAPSRITSLAERCYREEALAHRRHIEAAGMGWQVLGRRRGGARLFKKLLMFGDRLLGWVGLRPALVRFTGAPRLRELTAFDPLLPAAFEGYRILHLTDLHLEMAPELVSMSLACLPDRHFDLVAITGDFRDAAPYDQLADDLGRLLAGLSATDGVIATLGNHDSAEALPLLDKLQVRVLCNESAVIEQGGAKAVVTALDDSHYYYHETAVKALTLPYAGYKILLAHTPDFYSWGRACGYRLYLCGHTHGGQICLPGGKPLLLHTIAPAEVVAEPWQQGAMLGFTGRGLGYSRLAIRSFCQPEIAVITLRRTPQVGGSRETAANYWQEAP